VEANPVFVNPFFRHGQRHGLSQPVAGPQLTVWRKNAVVGGILISMVLSRIADHPINRIEEPLPWNLAAELTGSSRRAA